MLVIGNTLLSEDLFSACFCCDLSSCKGLCCIEGDAGAPLEEEEVGIIEDCLDDLVPYLTQEGKSAIEQNGSFDYDVDGCLVTPLINDRDCAYVYYDQGIAKCAIEKAYLDGKISFKKPISCHLYPIRVKKYAHYQALNYHQWEVCEQARKKGKELKISVFAFLREPLIRQYGLEWVEKVEEYLKMRQLKK